MNLPLSYEQEAHLQLGEGAYSPLNLAFDVSGPFDPDLLRRAVGIMMRRHEALRLRLCSTGGKLTQTFLEPTDLDVPCYEVSAEQEAAADIIRERSIRRFDLQSEPPIEVTLVRIAPRRTRVLLLVDHLCIDGWGAYLLAQELWSIYDGLARGDTPAAATDSPYDYGQYVRDQRPLRDRTPRGDERRRRHWRELSARFADAARVPAGDGMPGSARTELCAGANEDEARRIAALAAALGISPNVVPLACFGLAVAAEAGACRAGLWFSYAGRDRSVLHGLVGMVYRRIPLVLECGREQALGDFFRGAEREWYEAVRNSRVPYTPMAFLDELQRYGGMGKDPDILYNQVTYFGRRSTGNPVIVGDRTFVVREDRYYDPGRWADYCEPRLRIIGYADSGVLLRAIHSDMHISFPAASRIMERTGMMMRRISAEKVSSPLGAFAGN